jgi:hypothetical protein
MYKQVAPKVIYEGVPSSNSVSQGVEIELLEAACLTVKKTTDANSTVAPVTIQASLDGEDWADLPGVAATVSVGDPFILFDLGGTGSGLSFRFIRLAFGALTTPGDAFQVKFGAKGV